MSMERIMLIVLALLALHVLSRGRTAWWLGFTAATICGAITDPRLAIWRLREWRERHHG